MSVLGCLILDSEIIKCEIYRVILTLFSISVFENKSHLFTFSDNFRITFSDAELYQQSSGFDL